MRFLIITRHLVHSFLDSLVVTLRFYLITFPFSKIFVLHRLIVHRIGSANTCSTAPHLRAPLKIQMIRILQQPLMANLFESELKFHHPEYMLDSSAGSGLHTVARPLLFFPWMVPRAFSFVDSPPPRAFSTFVSPWLVYADSPHISVSSPGTNSPNFWLSCTLPPLAATEWIHFVSASTPTCVVIPNYHRFPLRVECMSVSRL